MSCAAHIQTHTTHIRTHIHTHYELLIYCRQPELAAADRWNSSFFLLGISSCLMPECIVVRRTHKTCIPVAAATTVQSQFVTFHSVWILTARGCRFSPPATTLLPARLYTHRVCNVQRVCVHKLYVKDDDRKEKEWNESWGSEVNPLRIRRLRLSVSKYGVATTCASDYVQRSHFFKPSMYICTIVAFRCLLPVPHTSLV